MIESLIVTALRKSAVLQEAVASYKQQPAIFYQSAPHDQDKGWGTKQYPRLDYIVDWTYHPERKTGGTLQVNVWCIDESGMPPEDIGEEVRAALSDLFLTDETGTFSIIWNRTDAFDGLGNEPKVIGVTVTFDIVAFPVQMTGTPDPVLSAMIWTKQRQPAVTMIGLDNIPQIWRPTDQSPAVYFRLGGGESDMRPSNAVTWVRANLMGHIISPTVTGRQLWIRAIVDDIAIEQELRMDDGSPMFVKRMSYNTASNPLTQGQLSLTVDYGVLRRYPDSERMHHITLK